ncbi:hypothetical protein NQ314_007762 [Rhamnusium bicolor]|uniref:Uncharacterized protein n=1 Tax=Rhamnusium bicolor TaxID=1586634 RepID=A0AAV8YIZ8_9CUCU|nr:hypothetical protein NQ314_007762 [Rhamnusium bicolor]
MYLCVLVSILTELSIFVAFDWFLIVYFKAIMENILQNVFQHRNPDGIDHNVIRGIILHDIFDIDNPQEENARDNILLRPVFNLENIDDRDVKLNFRFDRDDIPRLCLALRIPELITTQSGYQATGK